MKEERNESKLEGNISELKVDGIVLEDEEKSRICIECGGSGVVPEKRYGCRFNPLIGEDEYVVAYIPCPECCGKKDRRNRI